MRIGLDDDVGAAILRHRHLEAIGIANADAAPGIKADRFHAERMIERSVVELGGMSNLDIAEIPLNGFTLWSDGLQMNATDQQEQAK